jgi:hypothetical protein
MEQQSRLAIPLNWRNLSQDEDLVNNSASRAAR